MNYSLNRKLHLFRLKIAQSKPYLFAMTARDDRPKLADPEDPKGPADPGDTDGTGLATETRVKTKKPSMYRVLLLNDDYTPMEFVVFVLEQFFNKSREQATRIMLHVHQKGVGVCGVYTFEVAETKVAQVMDLARRNEHPLQCTMEKED